MATRHFAYWLDRGRALAHSGKTDREAQVAFIGAERAAPLLLSINAMARGAVVAMLYRAQRRSLSDDLVMLAGRLGVDVPI
jgi:hypothetical protein